MRYSEILEASYQQDRLLLDLAKQYYEEILHGFATGRKAESYISASKINGIVLPYIFLDELVPESDYKIIFYLDPKMKQAGQFGTTTRSGYNYLSLPYNGATKPDITDFAEAWKNNRIVLIHEITHFLDYQRAKGAESVLIKIPKSPLKKYYRHGLEFNAYYQEIIDHFEQNHLENLKKNHSGILVDFNKFWTLILSYYEDIIQHWNKDYLIRFKKRLYQYWLNKIKPMSSK
jgi:hypothetical protein